jgi:hypothetical protein
VKRETGTVGLLPGVRVEGKCPREDEVAPGAGERLHEAGFSRWQAILTAKQSAPLFPRMGRRGSEDRG